MNIGILTALIFLPLIIAILLIFIPRKDTGFIKNVAFFGSLLVFVLSLKLFFGFDTDEPGYQFIEGPYNWIKTFNIGYHIGIDGISILLVILTTFLTPIVILSSYKNIKDRVKEYMVLMLLLETAMIGTLCAIDMFLFYVFWEFMLIPMYFIIGVWGGERKIYATIKFFLFTMAGSLFMLLAILFMGFLYKGQFGEFNLNFLNWLNLSIPIKTELILFLAFFLAFAIKVPLFPFHTWLPDAHVEAPAGGSVILAGVLLKMGTYGLLRFCIPLFPNASHTLAPFVIIISIIGIIYGALLAMAQSDLKKLIAYSSISHLGFVVLGIFSFTLTGVTGGIYQMVNHGLSTGALFLIVGILYERRHKRQIGDFGGIAKKMPVFTAIFMIVTLSSIGLPGLNGFIGEFLILAGSFTSELAHMKLATAFAATGVILAAIYMLWMFERVMFGPIKHKANQMLKDLTKREVFVLVPIILLIIFMGIFTKPFTERMEASVNHYMKMTNAKIEKNEVIVSGFPLSRE